MISLLKKVTSYFFNSERDEQVVESTSDIDSIISTIEAEDSVDITESKPVSCPAQTNENTCHRMGTITALYTNYGLIDGNLYFDIRDAPAEKLRVGHRVAYLAFRRRENYEWRVRKIYYIQEETWDKLANEGNSDEYCMNEDKFSEIQSSDSMKRSIIGQVKQREGREMLLLPGNVRCNLDEVSAEFIPLEGDWVVLDALVEVNEEVCDLSGAILDIEKIRPLRSRIVTGFVSQWNQSGEGIIERDVYFSKDSCEHGYMPYVGDKVVAEAIESEQGKYTWRALTVVPLVSYEAKNKHAPQKTQEINNLSETNKFKVLLKDKRGIIITENLNFGALNVGEKKELVAEVKNTGPCSQLFVHGKFHSRRSESQFVLYHPRGEEEIVINPEQTVEFHFGCTGRFIGNSSELFVFTFKGFKIGRHLQVDVQEPSQKSLIPTKNEKKLNSMNTQRKLYKGRRNGMLVSGVRPIKPPAFVPVRLGSFPVPNRIWEIVVGNEGERRNLEDIEKMLEDIAPCLASDLKMSNYSDRFHMLLYLEEIQANINMHMYSLERVCFRLAGPNGEFLALEVPGLAEKRPSLLLGDRVIASDPDSEQDEKCIHFEGFIHKVLSREVWIKFNSNFHSSYNGNEYNVSFNFSRTPMRRCHAAVNMALTHLGPEMLFPTRLKVKPAQLHLEEDASETTLLPTCTDSISQIGKTQINRVSDSIINKKGNEFSFLKQNNMKSTKEECSEINTCKSPSVISSSVSSPASLEIEKTAVRMPVIQRLFGSNETPSSDCHRNDSVARAESCSGTHETTDVLNSLLNFAFSDKGMRPAQTNHPKGTVTEDEIPDFQKRKLKWYNKWLNFHQKEAVRNILKGEARPLPYVIFGPPGTGKTITLVEAVLQILTLLPDSRILVATPSNSSADLVAERLLDSGLLIPGDLVRLVGYHCIEEGIIPERLVPYCTTGNIRLLRDDHEAYQPSPVGEPLQTSSNSQTLGRHRITVGTCIALGQLYIMGFTQGHFTHVFVDEAGQATEPEILVPLDFIHTSSGQVVLAGDPLQLGPVIMSRLASRMGLADSYLSRLLQRFPYQRDPQGFPLTGGFNPSLITRLVMNYRSVPEILTLPSSLFYSSHLEPQVSQVVGPEADLLKSLASELPQRGVEFDGPPALVFHGVRGENYQEGESPSWFNPQEVVQALNYVNTLYHVGLSPSDIGIITPYQKQVKKLRLLLDEFEVPLPKIGSVEEFQGQERKVIILSAVRSSPSLLKTDITHSLGFVASPKRLNVALTRARALLIILGNSHLLARDPYWRSVLNYCVERGGYTGCDLPMNYNSIVFDDIDSM